MSLVLVIQNGIPDLKRVQLPLGYQNALPYFQRSSSLNMPDCFKNTALRVRSKMLL